MDIIFCRQCKYFAPEKDEEDLKDFGRCLEGRGEPTNAGSMVFFPDEMFCDSGERK